MKASNRLYYLTYGDAPSGVYFSQVLDVGTYLSQNFPSEVRVIALLSPRLYFAGRKKIKARYPNAIVWPALPGMHRWEGNRILLGILFAFLPKGNVMARGPLAALLAHRLRERGKVDQVTFDGRGAYAAEWSEYEVVPHPGLKAGIEGWEQKAVLNSDFRLAVSHELISYWQNRYGYDSQDHIIVPCTLNSHFQAPELSQDALTERRQKLGYGPDDLLLIYSGSAAGWQSFTLLEGLLKHWMESHPQTHLLFLTQTALEQLPLYKEYPQRIRSAWLPHEEVPLTLAAGDYGILIRESSVTNQVASPTKFAEYLSSGLAVLISEGLGDYTEAVQKENLGMVISGDPKSLPALPPISLSEKERLQQYALTHFRKADFKASYAQLPGIA